MRPVVAVDSFLAGRPKEVAFKFRDGAHDLWATDQTFEFPNTKMVETIFVQKVHLFSELPESLCKLVGVDRKPSATASLRPG